jgi:cytoskeleton protein RodZ
VNTSAEETLRDIARQLVEAREAQNMTLEEVATKTFIPMRILKALEAAETFKLPEPIFVQGFIKRYAKLVGLDGEALAQKIPLEQTPIAVNIVKEPAARELVPPVNRRVSLNELNLPTPREAASSKNGMNSTSAIDRPAWFIPALAGLVGIAAISTIALFLNRPQTSTEPTKVPAASSKPSASPKPKPSAIAVTQPTVTPTPSPSLAPSPSVAPSPSPSPSPSPNAVTGPVNVGVNLSAESWVEVRADGEVVFEGTMKKGTTQNWSAKKEIEVSSGNAGAVTISQNQQPGKVMGAMGDIKTMTFSGKSTP